MALSRNIVLIDGVRTPFLRSGTGYMDLMSYQLGLFAIKGLLTRTGLDPETVDSVVMGTVISNLKTSNVARESALPAGIPGSTPCHTVTQACISANRAMADGIGDILSGQSEVVIAGGVDSTSDTPIGYKKTMRKKLFRAQKIKGIGDGLKFAATLRPGDFLPEKPAVKEFSTGRTMGQDCEILVSRFGITRSDQDEYAVRSHQLAGKAAKEGLLSDVVEVSFPPRFKSIKQDNGIRADTNKEKMSRLKPAFDRKYGSLTAANSSFLTDGAAAVLLMTEEKAVELGLRPKARIVDFVFTGQDLKNDLLLGPVYATSKVLEKAGMKLDDLDVLEFHEAFAGQVLSVLKCLGSDEFARENLGTEKAAGRIKIDKLNSWGGSLSIGHPFGATGGRLVATAVNRLIHENGKYGLVAACAGGAHGHAMILERYDAA